MGMDSNQRKITIQRLARQHFVEKRAPPGRYGLTHAQLQQVTEEKPRTKRKVIRSVTKIRPLRAIMCTRPESGLLLETPDFTPAVPYGTPSWFTYNKKAEVSIIVPLFKSVWVLGDLITSMDLDENTEMIFVDDACPQNSKASVISTWTNKNTSKPVGRIYWSPKNQGFATTCNIGAYYATGDYLVFLNADTTVSHNWLRPIIRLLKKPEVGIVGNLQIFHNTDIIDSTGSEWSWAERNFLHIGGVVYNHKRLSQHLHINRCPPDLFKSQEREMVTGACIGIRKQVFDEVGGFNPNYRIGYWEDSDLCMTVREKGYKIMYQPNSKIYHKRGHSGQAHHKYVSHNIQYFTNKWINSGRIDPLVGDRRSDKPEVKSILLKREAGSGDVLMAAALAPALKKKYPGSKITFLTSCVGAVQGNPHIDKVISQEDRTLYHLYCNLDLAYEYRPKIPMLQAYADTLGVPIQDCQPYIKTEPVPDLPSRYAVFHCDNEAQWVGRTWPMPRFEILANRIAKRLPVVCVGGSKTLNGNHINLTGHTSIPQLAYVIQNACVFVGIDSFPMHIAQTFNVPGVCFFGSINPALRIIKPNMIPVTAQGLHCLGCHHRKPAPCMATQACELGVTECSNLVTVDNMLHKIEQILSEQGL